MEQVDAMKTSNIVLVIVGLLTVLFTVEMIHCFHLYQSVPNQLIICWFTACTGEAGILGWIKTAKVKIIERQQQLEDYKRMKQEQEEQRNAGNH